MGIGASFRFIRIVGLTISVLFVVSLVLNILTICKHGHIVEKAMTGITVMMVMGIKYTKTNKLMEQIMKYGEVIHIGIVLYH